MRRRSTRFELHRAAAVSYGITASPEQSTELLALSRKTGMTPPPETPPGDALYSGKHRVYLEPPDTFFFVAGGDVTADDVLRLHALLAAFEQDKEFILALADASRLGSMPADARKLASRSEATQRLRGIAIYGTSYAKRVVLLLVTKAFALLKGSDSLPIVSLATEAEARAWLAERRKALLAGT